MYKFNFNTLFILAFDGLKTLVWVSTIHVQPKFFLLSGAFLYLIILVFT